MLQKRLLQLSLLLLVLSISLACRQPSLQLAVPTIIHRNDSTASPTVSPTQTPAPTSVAYLPFIRQPGDASIATPTPDEAKALPEIRSDEEYYVVQRGDSLGKIAASYNITVGMIVDRNQITNPDLLEVGVTLVIPAPIPGAQGTAFKIIPDSELVFGPFAASFDLYEFTEQFDSYLNRYSELVDGTYLTGPEIVQRVALDYSINPRLLLAVLEYQSGWVTLANPSAETWEYPIGFRDNWRKGLYLQLTWAANNLNRGYYLWKVNGIGGWLMADGTIIPVDPTINAGTAGVQQLFALLYDRSQWDYAISPDGLFATFSNFFGHPFDYAVEPLIPNNLEQPSMQLPFEPDVNWAFTGGPHGGWGDGSAWAAIDFAPGNNGLGCGQSNMWVVAVADGLIVEAENGRVIEDLDGDGNEGSGWTVLYMHIEGRDRVQAGDTVSAGDRIGHPSCEGGYSTGTHTHLARRYNGEWIPADQTNTGIALPFDLDGWVSNGNGIEYNGYLERDGEWIEALEGFYPENTIYR